MKIGIKNILLLIFGIAIFLSIIKILFKKEYKAKVVVGIFNRSFSDTINYVYSFKDDYGTGIQTSIRGYDTPFCFNGINRKNNVWYYEFAKKGDIFYKKKSSDTFFIVRKDNLYSFELIECTQYIPSK